VAIQAAFAVAYYIAVVFMVRMSGKRLAGQMTAFDLIVMIAVAVVAQQLALGDTRTDALVFIATVLATHRGLAALEARSSRVRRWVRGKARALVADGTVLEDALRAEGLSEADLRAGLRKLGYQSPAEVRLAVLEETGHISALPRDAPKDPAGKQ
jgi:uncharacterized membrane protein YcaP (DUF421 family)